MALRFLFSELYNNSENVHNATEWKKFKYEVVNKIKEKTAQSVDKTWMDELNTGVFKISEKKSCPSLPKFKRYSLFDLIYKFKKNDKRSAGH